MALRAVRGELCGSVVRGGGAIVVRQVAALAGVRRVVVIAVVALIAAHGGMRPDQRITVVTPCKS